MPNFYRFINNTERRQLWPIFSFQIILVTFSWYFIEYILLHDECYKILKLDYYSGSLYINVPDSCEFWTPFWFRINHYTIYGTYIFSIHILTVYEISTSHTVMHMYTCVGLMVHCFRTSQQDYLIYYQGPTLSHLLVLMLYLESQPFEDSQMIARYYRICNENNDRSFAQAEINIRCIDQAMCKMRQCNSTSEIDEVMRQTDEQIKISLLRCQYLDYPVLTSPEQKKTNILVILFIYVTSLLLILLAVWNMISSFRPGFFGSFNPKNTTRIL
ncbi:unnamed protein product [Rotaria sp. Silwood1]|nr:unnamed protein product [Rotaria sp. Silwood1]